jgi:sigma-B regulation protein RsbU (phosphoserine phosphatase)
MDTALQAVLQLTTILTGTDWALLYVRERADQMMRMGPSAGIGRQTELMLSDVRISIDSLGISTSPPDGGPVEISLPDPLASLLEATNASAVPLGTAGDTTGVFIMEGKQIPDRQISLIRGIANQISLRLENYKLIEEVAAKRSLERELETARTIQQSFLPREIPDHDGWEIGVNWSFARQVGGDFYDFIPLADGPNGKRWGVVIADVTDKGIPAALFMALCRTLLRSVAINRVDPGSTLTRLNELIFADTQAELLVSIIYAVWEPEIAQLSFANAGHNPPLLFKPFHPAEVLSEHGIIIGAKLDASYTTQTMELRSGELMVFYTDGVTEAMDASGDMFGVHRLENLVLGQRHWTGQGIVDQIAKRVADFCGTFELPDDLTTVVLYRPDTD